MASTAFPAAKARSAAHKTGRKRPDNAALAYQTSILPGVSRTFALTIPQLPDQLETVVANAYLLCRIADTIEDEPDLTAERKQYFQALFKDVVGGRAAVEPFARELSEQLSEDVPQTERELVRNTPTVLRVTRRFTVEQRAAIERCLDVMCGGMHHFESQAGAEGLADVEQFNDYCYYVAGVVGEMLTDLFCNYSPVMAAHHDAMMKLAVDFGQGLQMTNIIKDVWDDHSRRICWYPRDVFERHGFDLAQLSLDCHGVEFEAGVQDLIAMAHGHLRGALAYILLIPAQETGIRLFCAWAVGMALLTLDKVNANLDFIDGKQVKISHQAVAWTTLLTRATARSDTGLTALFNYAARRLPPPIAAEVSLPSRRTAGTPPRL